MKLKNLEVLTALLMKIYVFWDMTPCRWQRSGGAHCPYLEGGPR
jgi:hypothetical protein